MRAVVTLTELLDICDSLPMIPAPPGFAWASPWMADAMRFFTWRKLSSGVFGVSGICSLALADLERPQPVRYERAILQQKQLCWNLVTSIVSRTDAIPK